MGTRGRPSSASLQIATRPIETIQRQKPPYDLSDEEVEVWASVVDSHAADWFSPATAPLLAEYCRHVIRARRMAELIEKATSDIDPLTKRPTLTIEDFDRLLKMGERESRAIATLATKMRIAQQSTSNHRGHSKSKSSRKPWES